MWFNCNTCSIIVACVVIIRAYLKSRSWTVKYSVRYLHTTQYNTTITTVPHHAVYTYTHITCSLYQVCIYGGPLPPPPPPLDFCKVNTSYTPSPPPPYILETLSLPPQPYFLYAVLYTHIMCTGILYVHIISTYCSSVNVQQHNVL